MNSTSSTESSSDHGELRLVNDVAAEIKHLLTDRGGDRHAPPWEPRQNVVIGVLPSTVAPPSPVATSNGDEDDDLLEDADPTEASIDELLSGDGTSGPSIGMSFAVRSDEPITVKASLDFAIYVEEYATLEELRDHIALAASTAHDASQADDVADASPSPGNAPTRRPVTVLGAWRRIPISLSDIEFQISLDEEHTEVHQPITRAVRRAIDKHFDTPAAARPFSTRTRTISTADLADHSAYLTALQAKHDPHFEPVYPQVRLTGFAQPLDEGCSLVNVSVTNASILGAYPFQDLHLYDCRLRLTVARPAEIQKQRFLLAPRDYRFEDVAEVWGQGNACVVARSDSGELVAETLPVFHQPVVEPRSDHVGPAKWDDLADDPRPTLDAIEAAMRDYLQQWDDFIQGAEPGIAAESSLDRSRFEQEIERFRLGRRAMQHDDRLGRAFRLANRAFSRANASKDYDSWRLFQIVYLVSHLPDLAAREHTDDPLFRQELDFADVLWVPTGGGKTEAYLGLIVTALLYDRMRRKAKGVTAWLKFPLRMLSVQQLSRVLRVLVEAERIRREDLDGAGDPFELGYLVGGSNTPNSLTWPREWWPGFEAAVDAESGSFDERRLLAECPFCNEEQISIDIDEQQRRLRHTCGACGEALPLHMSDEEIFRFMPSVLVGTVDKLTGLAWFGEFVQFSHGARWRCPDHGYFSFTLAGRCLAGRNCGRKPADFERQEAWHDPVPALIIQDEMHLLKEELGAFDAHYEGALAELQARAGIGLPSKVLAASATIEQYEDQLRQAYGRKPRSFPTPGFERTRSFYSQETTDTRRLYLGVMPHYRRKADVAGMIQRHLLSHISAQQDTLGPSSAGKPRAALEEAFFNYELSLAYVNSKIHGDQIADDLRELAQSFVDHDQDHLAMRVLTGDVRVAELAEPISRIEKDTLDTPRSDRIRALVGTSVVSHGVDLERLNMLVMAGLPPTVADYIQASSRSGRNHVGLVVTVFDAFSKRERSTFVNFNSFHQFLDRMVAPVPVNKYAYFGAERTLPGIAVALLWDLALDPDLDGPAEGIKQTRWLSPWWQGHANQLKLRIRERLERSYRAVVNGVNDRVLEDELIERVLHRWEEHELHSMVRFNHDRTTELFMSRVLTSFRDVDEAVGFSAMPKTAYAFEQLTGTPPERKAT